MKLRFAWVGLLLLAFTWAAGAPKPSGEVKPSGGKETGVPVAYQLPADGVLPRTYLVTLAIVDPKNPDWIISTFVAGAPRTVTAENKGKFTETWDGLDENFMPVPPGDYAVKGIYTPARQWSVDGDWHAITPKFVGGISAWVPPTDAPDARLPFGGDPVGSPMRDVAVGPNGVAVFYYQYLENGLNAPMIDLKKPVGFGQFICAFNSGGAAGGQSVATDGETVWAASSDGGPKFVYRTDGKPFGSSPSANRRDCYLAEGYVASMAALREQASGKSFVYIAQGAKFVGTLQKKGNITRTRYTASDTDFADIITVHDGGDGKILATLPLPRPQSLSVQGGKLYALHADGAGLAVSASVITAGVPDGKWQRVFAVPATIKAFDMKVDSHGRFYLSDPTANKVYQLDAAGKVLRTFGSLAVQKPGTYDRETLMEPEKLATWRDTEGKDRLIIVEMAGPNRTSEWSADDGKLLREFTTYQTKANDGYAVDEEHPEDLYILGHRNWLTRFKMDLSKQTWVVDAVWPDVGNDPRLPGLSKPRVIRVNNRTYLACERSHNVYRLDGDRWVLSAGLVAGEKGKISLWHDANGNGHVDDEELTPCSVEKCLSYHGQNWLPDLSYLAVLNGSTDVQRLSPSGFDEHGNPIFKEWKKLVTDPEFAARAAGKADALHGGNEMGDTYGSWVQATESSNGDLYVQARSGPGFNANQGAQHKISRYVLKANGEYAEKWRVGRAALNDIAKRGEMYGGMRIRQPINGLVSVIDQTRCGVLLYTDEGLYVDTLFPDLKTSPDKRGSIYQLPGEFFAGIIYPNKNNGKIYIGVGKYTPVFFEVEGWSEKENPVHPLTTVQKTVSINFSQIAAPPEIALKFRGGAGKTQIARLAPALGGVVLDGSLAGWESCEPVQFGKEQTVEARCLYDPDHLYVRWHARLGGAFQAKPLPPLTRLFTHDQMSDTVSLYIQGDPNAPSKAVPGGRPGDVRFTFGLFQSGTSLQPVGVGYYPTWPGKGQPQVYRTIVRETSFAHVGAIPGVQLGYALDPDGKGFVIAAAIPRAAIPALTQPFGTDLRTRVNFEATFGGHNKFWWANSDGTASTETYDEPTEAGLYPGSWAPVTFQGIGGDGIAVRNWQVCGPFGGPGAEKFSAFPRDKNEVQKFFEAAVYPPDSGKMDPNEVFQGPMIKGYWGSPAALKWKPDTIADLDTRLHFGTNAQVWFATTWIHSPTATEIPIEFQSFKMNLTRWFLNGQPFILDKGKEKVPPQDVTQVVKLQAGWNQIMVRTFSVGYGPRAGLVIKGDPAAIWKLRFSGVAPKP